MGNVTYRDEKCRVNEQEKPYKLNGTNTLPSQVVRDQIAKSDAEARAVAKAYEERNRPPPYEAGPKDPIACGNAKRMENFSKDGRLGDGSGLHRWVETLKACQ
jgi:hypothetical protein